MTIPAELEEVVLACLAKDPDQRPQSTADLRQQIEACAVEPWGGAEARAWWREHQPELDDDDATSSAAARTIGIDIDLR